MTPACRSGLNRLLYQSQVGGASTSQRLVCLHAGGCPCPAVPGVCSKRAAEGRKAVGSPSHTLLCLPACQNTHGREGRPALRRDVKLENIFIAEDGRVRLGDFGLTMSMKQELAISPVGTVEYMAPEVRACAAPHLSVHCS